MSNFVIADPTIGYAGRPDRHLSRWPSSATTRGLSTTPAEALPSPRRRAVRLLPRLQRHRDRTVRPHQRTALAVLSRQQHRVLADRSGGGQPLRNQRVRLGPGAGHLRLRDGQQYGVAANAYIALGSTAGQVGTVTALGSRINGIAVPVAFTSSQTSLTVYLDFPKIVGVTASN
jgi:hypothetical protein